MTDQVMLDETLSDNGKTTSLPLPHGLNDYSIIVQNNFGGGTATPQWTPNRTNPTFGPTVPLPAVAVATGVTADTIFQVKLGAGALTVDLSGATTPSLRVVVIRHSLLR